MTRFAILDDHRSFADALTLALSRIEQLESVGTSFAIPAFIELCRASKPDVVLIDYRLQSGTGLDCAVKLRRAGVVTRLIMLTAYSRPESESRTSSDLPQRGMLIPERREAGDRRQVNTPPHGLPERRKSDRRQRKIVIPEA